MIVDKARKQTKQTGTGQGPTGFDGSDGRKENSGPVIIPVGGERQIARNISIVVSEIKGGIAKMCIQGDGVEACRAGNRRVAGSDMIFLQPAGENLQICQGGEVVRIFQRVEIPATGTCVILVS